MGEMPHEKIYQVEFPERPGALKKFLSVLQPQWNITLFHYRRSGELQYMHSVCKTTNTNTCLKSAIFSQTDQGKGVWRHTCNFVSSLPHFRFVEMQVTGRLRHCLVYSFLQTSKKLSRQ